MILREGDPVDVDGNGLFDDDAFYQNFGNDDFTLLDNGDLYFSCTLRNGAGTAFAQGLFFRKGGNLQRAFCFADGSGVACPCANDSAVGAMAGCLNGNPGNTGGRIESNGFAHVSADTLVLSGSQLIPFGPGLFFQSTGIIAGGTVFGNGRLCLNGAINRIEICFADANGQSASTVSVSAFGGVAAGDTRHYQCWYRDAPAYCVMAGFNLTNACTVVWGQ